jgi:hypothetical protein
VSRHGFHPRPGSRASEGPRLPTRRPATSPSRLRDGGASAHRCRRLRADSQPTPHSLRVRLRRERPRTNRSRELRLAEHPVGCAPSSPDPLDTGSGSPTQPRKGPASDHPPSLSGDRCSRLEPFTSGLSKEWLRRGGHSEGPSDLARQVPSNPEECPAPPHCRP